MEEMSWQLRAEAAERTVALLKKKVRQLYDTGAQTAIHRELSRGRERAEQQRQRHAVTEARNAELERYSAALERTVAERTHALSTILDNVTFGFLVVDEAGRVQEGFTRSCAALLEREVCAGDSFAALLGVEDRDEGLLMEFGLLQVFEGYLDEVVALAQLPGRFHIGDRVIEAEGAVVRDEAGTVSGVLFTLSDTTALEAARAEALENSVLVGALRQKSAFVAFVHDTRSRLNACLGRGIDPVYVRRAVHTVKGNVSGYGLHSVAAVAHEAEDSAIIDPAGIKKIQAAFERFMTRYADVLAVPVSDQQVYTVSQGQLDAMGRMAEAGDTARLRSWLLEVQRRPVADLLGPIEALVQGLAERLGRRVHFELEGGEVQVDGGRLQPVINVLSHLLRNAIDHGIEPPEERGDKPAMGQVRLRFSAPSGGWGIAVEDDGRGVDWDTLSRIVGRAPDGAPLTHEQRLRLLIADGVSSRSRVTELSGRGLGMAAVAEVVQSLGGQLDITSVRGQGTRVSLFIPSEAQATQAA